MSSLPNRGRVRQPLGPATISGNDTTISVARRLCGSRPFVCMHSGLGAVAVLRQSVCCRMRHERCAVTVRDVLEPHRRGPRDDSCKFDVPE